jgi:anaerobic magnesium-protoporphyrin IX monomethyl ester cyclase
MRILLIEPPANTFTGLIKRGYPLGLCMLASIAREERVEAVKVYDVDKSHGSTYGLNFTDQRQNMALFLSAVNDERHPIWREIEKTLNLFRPDLVGITTMTISYASSLRVAKLVKRWNGECKVIMGGAHASVMPRAMIEWPYTDAVVKGEGEEAFRAIILRLGSGSAQLSDIPGVITKDSPEKIFEQPLELENLDSLPLPDRSALLNLECFSPEDMGLILTSRGCPFHCSYCSNFTRRTRFSPVERVIQEINEVTKRFGTVQFMFKDDSFTLNRQRIVSLCEGLLGNKSRILWESTTRLDLIDEQLIRLMKRSGCNRVGVGIESGDEEILQAMNKRLTKETIRGGTELLNKMGLFWTGYFMMGLPMETEDQMLKTLQFMRELRPPYAAVGIYKPYPGTKLFNMAADLGLVESEVTNDHFFETNPVDYFLKDPRRRTINISEARLGELTRLMEREFDRSNKRPRNLFKRALTRRRLYYRSPGSFATDVLRATKWLLKLN